MRLAITEIFCFVDDFSKIFLEYQKHKLIGTTKLKKYRGKMSLGEMLTIMIMYSHSPCKCFKHYYKYYIIPYYQKDFPNLISYNRFVEYMPSLLFPLTIMLHCLQGKKTGHYYLDSTKLAVCHNKRIYSHKVFKGFAARGKTTMGWFFGLKLHLIINHTSEVIAVKITKGNVDDRKPLHVMTADLIGNLYADKGYIGKEHFVRLYRKGLKLIVGIKRNMKNRLVIMKEKIMHRKRFIIETIFDYMKNKMNLEHSRHRSPINAFTHIIATIVAFALMENKPRINTPILIKT